MTDATNRKKHKNDHRLSEKEETKIGRLSVCVHMRFKRYIFFRSKLLKTERGLAVMSLVLITACSMYRTRFWSYVF